MNGLEKGGDVVCQMQVVFQNHAISIFTRRNVLQADPV